MRMGAELARRAAAADRDTLVFIGWINPKF
jgi:hypothetical protein